jgi:exodeoxyribonuclease VII small subunit
MAQHDDTTDGEGGGISFEAALAALENVVTRLEKGELSLEESLHAYEEGVRLVHAARGRLDGMQKRLDQLLDDGSTRPLKKKSDQATPPPPEPPAS